MNTPFDPEAFARQWIADWNSRAIAAIVGHYTQDGIFISPRAHAATGNSKVTGHAALTAYWPQAPVKFPDLHFTFDRLVWDRERHVLVVFYVSRRNGNAVRAAEMMAFNSDGKIFFGEALYGADL